MARNPFAYLVALLLSFSAGLAQGEQPKPQKLEIPSTQISAEFPYTKKSMEVLGSEMTYLDEGEGRMVVFLHGNPTSSYLWRNIVPHVVNSGFRAIAPDLIGMGDSGKPDIDYTYADHSNYLAEFFKKLKLRNAILIVHDWGSVLGIDYARNHRASVDGLVMMEALLPPVFPAKDLSGLQRLEKLFTALRTQGVGEEAVLKQNAFVEQVLFGFGIVRQLSDAEMAEYRRPFQTEQSRVPTLQFPRQLPIGGVPGDVAQVIIANGKWLSRTRIPKLHFYAHPGALNPKPVVDAIAARSPNTETRFVGVGTHFIQEDQPLAIGYGLADWLRRNF